jgi:hypothetical protein
MMNKMLWVRNRSKESKGYNKLRLGLKLDWKFREILEFKGVCFINFEFDAGSGIDCE